MMQITCPWCGPREQNEFYYGGEAKILRPAKPHTVSDCDWAEYLFVRENPAGTHHERWLHLYGCGQWFQVTRDTLTHNIEGVSRIGEPAPKEIR